MSDRALFLHLRQLTVFEEIDKGNALQPFNEGWGILHRAERYLLGGSEALIESRKVFGLGDCGLSQGAPLREPQPTEGSAPKGKEDEA